jgi:uroporphyrinogen-III synthase
MQPPLLIIRPEPGATATQAAAAALGLVAERFPLFTAQARDWEAPAPDTFDALLLGSAQACRFGGGALGDYAGKPAFCVGSATARAAQAVGLTVAAQGEGGLQAMLESIPPQRLLRLAGEAHVPLEPPTGLTMITRVAYASVAQPLPTALARLLLVEVLPAFILLLHSGEAARHFIAETDRLALPRGRIHAITIGPRVTEIAAQTGDWASLATAERPDDAAMLAMAAQTCQTVTMMQQARGQA